MFNKWRYGKYINSKTLIKWLEGQKYGYIKNKRDFVTYGSLEDDFNYDENDFECNRYDSDIVKSIAFMLDNGLLDMEVEEVTDEDNVLEVWIR